MRKLAAFAMIGFVFIAAICLRPPMALPPLPAHTALLVHAPAPISPGVRPGSDRGQTGVRPGSESEYEATQVVGTSARQELRTPPPAAPRPLELLPARTFVFVPSAPTVAAEPIANAERGVVTRAFRTAGRESADAFRLAGRGIRRVF